MGHKLALPCDFTCSAPYALCYLRLTTAAYQGSSWHWQTLQLTTLHSTTVALHAGTGRKPFIIVHTALLELLKPKELQAVIAHELGHLKCDHGLWLTVANVLASGTVQLVPFFSGELAVRFMHQATSTTASCFAMRHQINLLECPSRVWKTQITAAMQSIKLQCMCHSAEKLNWQMLTNAQALWRSR